MKKENWKKDFGEKLVNEKTPYYLTHKGDIFSLDWLLDFIDREKQKSRIEQIEKDVELINEIIKMSDYCAPQQWFDALRCAMETIKNQNLISLETKSEK